MSFPDVVPLAKVQSESVNDADVLQRTILEIVTAKTVVEAVQCLLAMTGTDKQDEE